MASKLALTCNCASTLVTSNNRASSSSFKVGLGPHSDFLKASSKSKTPSSTSLSLIVRAQEGAIEPLDIKAGEHLHKNVFLHNTSFYGKYSTSSTVLLSYVVRTPWDTNEDENEIKMWFDMAELEARNVKVNIMDDLLIINGDGGIDANGTKIDGAYDSIIQLPSNCLKEQIKAVFKNGGLYITMPKITKVEHKPIHIHVKSVQ
ncbi:uncharacterized protein LOC104890570 [Beta vulgaris subsp. vulgaris]|uniref:uncharacterized protein LOC104890570 n=1 Tax=Beta vulgaris subsp. vulgaris TaxID=3555 RepID=UPI00203743A0|nr:uncharacterized protein LOC104890570 [Beta vulgaris subsp. vulgaris]